MTRLKTQESLFKSNEENCLTSWKSCPKEIQRFSPTFCLHVDNKSSCFLFCCYSTSVEVRIYARRLRDYHLNIFLNFMCLLSLYWRDDKQGTEKLKGFTQVIFSDVNKKERK